MRTRAQAKPSHAYVKSLVMVAFLVGLCLSGIGAQAYVISDNFDLVGPGRTAGARPYGTTTMVGDAIWQGTSSNDGMVFSGDDTNGYLTPNYAGWGYGGGTVMVPVSFASGNTIKAQFDLYNIRHGTDSCGTWLQLGSGGNADTNGLKLIVWGDSNAGLVQLFNSALDYFGGITAASYVYLPNGFNTYSVFYDSVAKACTITANGVSTTLSLGDYVPTVNGVGISMNPFWSSSQADNFSVEVLPEPATLALLLAMGGLALGRRDHRG